MKSALSKEEKKEWQRLLTEYCKYKKGTRIGLPEKYKALDKWYKKYLKLMNEKKEILLNK